MPVPQSIRRHPLHLGATGPTVRQWQQLLAKKGFVLNVDGTFGAKTEHVTRVAQRWARVNEDGVVGPITWTAVQAKKRTRRPGTVIRHVLGLRPKIVDCRHGRHGFPVHRDKVWGGRVASSIVAKLGHYTGGPASFIADARFHVETDYLDHGGAPAIAYTLGVDKDGTLFVFNNWESITWHCDGGHNTDTLGVVFRGGAEGPTLAQRRTLAWLWRELDAGIFQPSKTEAPWPRIVRSTTHQHVRPTSCPGVNGETFYRSISRFFETSL